MVDADGGTTVDGAVAYLERKKTTATKLLYSNLICVLLVAVGVLAVHGAIVHFGFKRRGTPHPGFLTFPAIELQILANLAGGMVLSAVTAMRLSSCKGGAVALSVLVVLALCAWLAATAFIVNRGISSGAVNFVATQPPLEAKDSSRASARLSVSCPAFA